MTGFLLPVDTADVEALIDALNNLPDDYYDTPTVQALVPRLRAARDLYQRWPDEWIRWSGVGRAKGRPQG